MKRYHEEEHIGAAEMRDYLAHMERLYGRSKTPPLARYAGQNGRFRKQSHRDCGNPKCVLCHREKVLGEKTPSERRADDRFKEQLRDT